MNIPDRVSPRLCRLGAVAVAVALAAAMPLSAQNSAGAAAPARGATTGKPFYAAGEASTIPGLNLEMRPLAAGTFMMGSPEDEDWREEDEGPQTKVTFSKAFWLGKTEVTQAQYQAIMGTNPAGFKGPDRPVEKVSWTEAMEFCRKLSERERGAGRMPADYEYTLPTEAQWEYACRAGTKGPYAGDLDAMGWYNGNSDETTHPVGQMKANAWGLADMHGNVWEWCLDWYGQNLPGGSVTDPKGPASGTFHVCRGGGWPSADSDTRSAYRFGDIPDGRGDALGFRVALSAVR